MRISGIVTFTTDFSTKDPYAGIMKGIVLTANPDARTVDITHDVPAHDITAGAFTLAGAYGFFPRGTIHVAVVDPGVGGNRRNIAVVTDRYCFIGPDNGLLSIACAREHVLEIREITNPPFIHLPVSPTFHGRDVFAPCAGHLSAKEDFTTIGPVLGKMTDLDYPHPSQTATILRGEVICIDSFGNLITNIDQSAFASFAEGKPCEISFGAERFDHIADTYEGTPPGMPLALFGSAGYLELAVNRGSAAAHFLTGRGASVMVRRA